MKALKIWLDSPKKTKCESHYMEEVIDGRVKPCVVQILFMFSVISVDRAISTS